MGTYSVETLIRKWGLGELTTEQAIGQILLILQELIRRVEALEGRGKESDREGSPGDKSSINRRSGAR